MTTLPFRKTSVLLSISLTLVFFLSLSSLGNANVGSTDSLSSIAQTTDTDGDGLTDDQEDSLGTDKTNKFGDKDNDGLYDFEEVLDIYGSNNTNNPKYNYNDSTTYRSVNGSVLDIYHYFNLSSNKTGYLRNRNSAKDDGFTDYLLWNVRISGGSEFSDVSYSSNIMMDVSFTGAYSGGSGNSDVSYNNNMITDVRFTGNYSGGSYGGDVNYTSNTVYDILISGISAGRSENGGINYTANVIVNDSYDTDGDGLGDGHELFESDTDPRISDGSSLSSFTLLIALVLFTFFGLVLVVYRVRRRVF